MRMLAFGFISISYFVALSITSLSLADVLVQKSNVQEIKIGTVYPDSYKILLGNCDEIEVVIQETGGEKCSGAGGGSFGGRRGGALMAPVENP